MYRYCNMFITGADCRAARGCSAMSPKQCKCRRPDSWETSGGGKCRKIDPLARKVDTLTLEFAEIKTQLLNLQQPAAQPASALATTATQSLSEMLPPILSPAFEILKEDVLSTRASEWPLLLSSQFPGYEPHHTEGLRSEPAVAALVLTPVEALRPDARGPRPQCRLTDDYIVKSYDTAARIGGLGNSMSHLILALSQTLQASEAGPSQGGIKA